MKWGSFLPGIHVALYHAFISTVPIILLRTAYQKVETPDRMLQVRHSVSYIPQLSGKWARGIGHRANLLPEPYMKEVLPTIVISISEIRSIALLNIGCSWSLISFITLRRGKKWTSLLLMKGLLGALELDLFNLTWATDILSMLRFWLWMRNCWSSTCCCDLMSSKRWQEYVWPVMVFGLNAVCR